MACKIVDLDLQSCTACDTVTIIGFKSAVAPNEAEVNHMASLIEDLTRVGEV